MKQCASQLPLIFQQRCEVGEYLGGSPNCPAALPPQLSTVLPASSSVWWRPQAAPWIFVHSLGTSVMRVGSARGSVSPNPSCPLQFRPQAQAVAARKKDQRSRLRLLQEERDELQNRLQSKEEEFKALGDQKVLTGEEFKRYAAQLREKHGTVKTRACQPVIPRACCPTRMGGWMRVDVTFGLPRR